MTWKTAIQVSTLMGVGIGGWISGSLIERRKHNLTYEDTTFRIKNMPGLPIFGKVSAASVFENKLPSLDSNLIPPETYPSASQKLSTEPSRTAQIMKFGFPGLDTIRAYDDYVLSYDKRNRVAHWVFEHLARDRLVKRDGVDRSSCEFIEDTSIHPFFRSTNKDYLRSGFDRGHMAAAGNHRLCQKDVMQTFFLSNMAPQVGEGFNRGYWNKLEKYVRKLTCTYKDVYVCTGPLYLPKREADGKTYVKYEVIGGNFVAVPTHFFKVVVGATDDHNFDMEAYVLPNQPIHDSTPLMVYQVPPESIERASGLLFFDQLSRSKLRKINGRKSTTV